MKLIIKITAFALSVLGFMLVLPLAVIKLSPAHFVTGFIMLLFFAVYPVMSAVLGALAGSDIKKLWWMPVAVALLFPLLFSLAVSEMVWELYIYSVIYLLAGLFFMAVSALVVKFIVTIGKQRNEK